MEIFNYRKLRARMFEYGYTLNSLAKAMEISVPALSYKLNNKTRWNQGDIVKVCGFLEIPKEEIGLYFFTI